MTYEELKSRLSQVETALESINRNNAPALDMQFATKSVQQLNTIKESLTAKLHLIEEGGETMFITTKAGDTKAVKMDRKAAMDLKKDPAITGIDTAKGSTIKEDDKDKGIEFTQLETKLLAKEVGRAVAKALKALGDEVGSMKAIRVEPNSFEVQVTYKGELRDDEFSFYVSNDELHLVDFSFDKVLVNVGTKPSGEPIINVDVLTNELQKHWKSLSEESNGGKNHYIKVKSHDYKKAMAILDQNVDPTYVKMDVVDDDGAGNTIIYFIFKHQTDFDDMYDDSDNKDSEFYQETEEDPEAFLYDVVMDLRANDIELADQSVEVDEAADNSDWAMKTRVINQHGRDMKKLDKIKKNTKPTRNPNWEKVSGNSPKVKAIIDKLEAKRDQVMRDMEQEAEPQGGPISDKYGDILNKIDNAIEKARKGKAVRYDDRQVDTSANENAIDPAEYGDIGKAYLAGFKKQHTLTLDQLEALGRKIVNQLYKGDFAAAKAKHLSEAGFTDDSLFTFGFDLDNIESAVNYLASRYKEGQDYELHIGRGDDLPNSVTLINPEMEADAELGDILDAAKGSDQTDYEDYRREENDYDNNELPEELDKGEVKKVKKIVGQLKNSVKGHGAQAKYLGKLVKESAARNLDEIFGALGYRQGFDEFIEDNPGCVEVIMEWIGSISDFQEKLGDEFSNDELENLGFYFGEDDDDYNESIKEGRGDLDAIVQIVTDMANEDGTTPKEAALEIIEALRDTYIIDAYDESVNENLNPEVSKKVAQFIKAMAKRYGYSEQDAVYSIMAALKQRKFDGIAENKIIKEFTDNAFEGADIIRMVAKNSPDMFGKQIFADLLPKGAASEDAAIKALHAHDKSDIKARMGQYAPMFVHVQYHKLKHEGEDYQMHQTQYYNNNFKDKDPSFNPKVTRITLFKDPEGEDINLGMVLVKTDEYVQDLRVLQGLGKRHMEEGSKVKYSKTKELTNEVKVGDTLTLNGRRGKVTKYSLTQATVDFGNGDVHGIAHSRIKDGKILKESKATCCGKCGRVHVKGNCKTPYLKGAKHCRTK